MTSEHTECDHMPPGSKSSGKSRIIRHDVLCIGAASWDITLAVSGHPGADEKTTARSMTSCGGGPAATAAVTVSRLGLAAGFIGFLGHDAFGDAHLEDLERAGVDTRWVQRGSTATPLSVVLVKPGGHRTVIAHTPPDTAVPEDTLLAGDFAPGILLMDGHQPLVSGPFVRHARKNGIPVILDAGSVHDGTRRLFDHADFLIASLKFAVEWTGRPDADAALAILGAQHPCVVITLGEKGLVWRRGSERGSLPAFPVDTVDTTGAGDVFHGAFAAALHMKMDWAVCLCFASAAAALACTRTGARNGIPHLADVEGFLRERA